MTHTAITHDHSVGDVENIRQCSQKGISSKPLDTAALVPAAVPEGHSLKCVKALMALKALTRSQYTSLKSTQNK